MTTSLELGCDCLVEIAYLDAVLHDTRGEPYTIPNAICIHEEDDAVLWKHVDAETGAYADERWPCGEFVVQSRTHLGLPEWTAQNRSVEDTDVVLWYVFGNHHITRPEEWPVMAVDTVPFWLKPAGFDRNPALDVPPTPHHCHPQEDR